MERYFEHYLLTGSGWIHTVLSFDENDQASIYFDLRSMGLELNRCKLTWAHDPQSQNYGLLKLRSIERYVDVESDETVPENLDELVKGPDEESRDFYRYIAYEYIVLPRSEVWIADGPDYEFMASLGWAGWHDRFDLVLMLHFSVAMMQGNLKETRLGAALQHLDKMNFKSVAKPVLGYPRIEELRQMKMSHTTDDNPF